MIGSSADQVEYWRAEARKLDEQCIKLRAENEQLRSKLALQESREGVRWEGPA